MLNLSGFDPAHTQRLWDTSIYDRNEVTRTDAALDSSAVDWPADDCANFDKADFLTWDLLFVGREAKELGYGEPGMIKVGPACHTWQSLDTIVYEHPVRLPQELVETVESLEAELAKASLVSLLSFGPVVGGPPLPAPQLVKSSAWYRPRIRR